MVILQAWYFSYSYLEDTVVCFLCTEQIKNGSDRLIFDLLLKNGITNRYLVNLRPYDYFVLVLVYIANPVLFKYSLINFCENFFNDSPSNNK